MADEIFEYTPNDIPERLGTLLYGKCVKYPYVQNDLWFVYQGTQHQFPFQQEENRGLRSSVYFVTEKYVTTEYFESFSARHENWMPVARLWLDGDGWDPKEEIHYSEMPYYTHVLKTGKSVRYGLARSAKPDGYGSLHAISSRYKEFPDRELWYVAFNCKHDRKIDWRGHSPDYYIVDKVCTNAAFIEAMEKDNEDKAIGSKKWMRICWAHPVGNPPWDAALDANPLPPNPFEYVRKEVLDLE